LLSIYVCWESVALGFGSFSKPGPGFFPFLAGLLFGFLGAVIFLRAWISRRLALTMERKRIPWRSLIIIFVSLIGFSLLLKPLGFNLSTFFFITVVLRVVERKAWTISIGLALAIALGAYVLFDLALQSQLPEGPFGF
jgi:signal transduction histidine kinase